MNTKTGSALRLARKIYHTLPLGGVRKILTPISRKLRNVEVGKTTTQKINGITLELDLGELIDYEIYREGCFEKDTHKRLNELVKEGMTILDVGANIGAHSFFMAQNAGPKGHVYAFEPASYAFKKLQTNAKLNPHLNVTLINAGLSDKEIKNLACTTFSSWRIDQSNKAGTIDHNVMKHAKGRKDHINLIPLDIWAQRQEIEKIDLIKLDIDGNELDFFKGATQTIKKHKPTILFEWAEGILKDRGYSGIDILNILKDINYHFEFEDGTKTTIEKANHIVQKEYSRNKIQSVNLIAFPSN